MISATLAHPNKAILLINLLLSSFNPATTNYKPVDRAAPDANPSSVIAF